ncbi:hypothetical protein [Aliarcobacter lanthieri]
MKATLTIKTNEIKTRVVWGFKPTTRVKPSKKIYKREKKGIIY